MSELVMVRYDAMLQSIADAKAVDEVVEIADQAEAMRQAARVMGNKQAEADLAGIRFRASRRLGQLMAAQKEAGLMAGPGRKKTGSAENPITLSEMNIGKKRADEARKLAAVPEGEFNQLVEEYQGRVVEEGERVTKALLTAGTKSQQRDDKYQALAARIAAEKQRLPGMGPYGLIYADPPWHFKTHSEAGMDRSEANHYPVMETADIIELQPPAFAHCALALWATAPMLEHGLLVLNQWGFAYKAHAIWRKYGDIVEGTGTGLGRGYWFRVDHELLLLGTRGNVPAPEEGLRKRSVLSSPPGINSAKPPIFRQLLNEYFPHVPKLEMFYRAEPDKEPPAGWDVWGAEAFL